MEDNLKEIIDIQKPKKFPFKFKLIAFVMIITFTFQSLHSINSHTYTAGVDNFHYTCGCFSCLPTHLNTSCTSFLDVH